MGQTKIRLRHVIFLLFCGCLFFFTCISFIYQTNNRFEEELYNYLKDVSIQNSEIMNLKIENNVHVLKGMTKRLFHGNYYDKDKIIKDLKESEKEIEYQDIGYFDVDGNVVLVNSGKEFSLADTAYFHKVKNGESIVTNEAINTNDDCVFITPFLNRDVYQGGLIMIQSKQSFISTITLTNEKELIHTAIIDEDGKMITADEEVKDHIQTHLSQIDETNLSEQLYHYYDENDNEFLLYYEPLDYNNWYSASIVSANIINDKTRDARMLTGAFVLIILVAVIFFIYQYLKTKANTKREMERLATYDEVTDSENYTAYLTKVKKWLRVGNRNDWCIIHFDIKDFKIINSMLGYIEADRLLKNVFDIIQSDCKEEECCTRVEADRFVVLWHLHDEKAIRERIERLDSEITNSFPIRKFHEELLLYYGVYLIKDTDSSFVKCIDKAKYCKNYCKPDMKIMFYDDSMYESRMMERRLENRMYHALGKGEFEVFVQPKVDTDLNNKIISAEALVRWRDPDEGYIQPSRFIPLFEHNGFLENLDLYTFDVICMHLARWNREIDPNLRISFNISRSYIFKEGFARRLNDIADIYAVNKSNIVVEIVESMLFEKPDQLINIIMEMKHYGFKIAMDDFGSGYSSLSMLKQIPFDILKIDQGFFRTEKNNEEKGRAIVDVIIQLANRLGVEVITEGIETKDQLDFVNRCGCHMVQGFYFYAPMKIEKFETLIALDDGFDKIEYSKHLYDN